MSKPEASSNHHEQPVQILCVDDEENILKALRRVFRSQPYRILMATNGVQGLELLRNTENIRLILSDQRMPDMTGSAFLTAAKALAPHIPRIILTGFTDKKSAEDAVSEGVAFRVLMKPWEDAELLQAVKDGLSGNFHYEEPS
jgi:response regulator RpfG family c-di-GMP phosphodiesterase